MSATTIIAMFVTSAMSAAIIYILYSCKAKIQPHVSHVSDAPQDKITVQMVRGEQPFNLDIVQVRKLSCGTITITGPPDDADEYIRHLIKRAVNKQQ